jgi:hypothetical protein
MAFFLTIVIPCVCPEINSKRDWLAGSGHLEKFGGPGGWQHDMATGLLVVSDFSKIWSTMPDSPMTTIKRMDLPL